MDVTIEPEAQEPERPQRDGPSGGYSSASTWESRYEEQEGTFDWYATYKELRSVFQEFCPPAPDLDVLMLGCGNSAFSAELYEAGYQQIVNVDIAEAAIKKMQEKFADLAMQWRVMDATAMSLEDASFDLAVDKGTLDAMMHGGTSGQGLAMDMTAEVWRILRPGGLFLLISHSGKRQPILDNAVLDKHGPSAQWELLELRKCALCPQAMLINILRSKLDGRPLMEGFKDHKMLKEAADEARHTLKQMQFLEAFRLFKAKKAKQLQETGETSAKKAESAVPTSTVKKLEGQAPEEKDESEDEKPRDSRRQPFCWVYVLRKLAS